jgi:hypothetical protein
MAFFFDINHPQRVSRQEEFKLITTEVSNVSLCRMTASVLHHSMKVIYQKVHIVEAETIYNFQSTELGKIQQTGKTNVSLFLCKFQTQVNIPQ